jgi:hypothetical protein
MIIGDHYPLRRSAGPRNEAKDEIVGAGGSRVPNRKSTQMFEIGRSDGRWSIEDEYQIHPPLANRIEGPTPHASPILLELRQTVKEVIAVDDDRHSG